MILGYTFSKKQLQRLNIDHLRMYVQAVNLFNITKYTGLDSELSGSSSVWGVDYGNYPDNQEEFLIGLNLSF